NWRPDLMLDGRRRKAHWPANERHLSRGLMRHLDFHAARLNLGVLEDFLEVVDWPAGNAGSLERLHPLGRCPLHHDGLEQLVEGIAVRHACAVSRKARVAGEMHSIRLLAELVEEV